MTARKKSNLGRQRQEQPVANPAAKLFKTKEADLFKSVSYTHLTLPTKRIV